LASEHERQRERKLETQKRENSKTQKPEGQKKKIPKSKARERRDQQLAIMFTKIQSIFRQGQHDHPHPSAAPWVSTVRGLDSQLSG
jgi:hypothetical protein